MSILKAMGAVFELQMAAAHKLPSVGLQPSAADSEAARAAEVINEHYEHRGVGWGGKGRGWVE